MSIQRPVALVDAETSRMLPIVPFSKRSNRLVSLYTSKKFHWLLVGLFSQLLSKILCLFYPPDQCGKVVEPMSHTRVFTSNIVFISIVPVLRVATQAGVESLVGPCVVMNSKSYIVVSDFAVNAFFHQWCVRIVDQGTVVELAGVNQWFAIVGWDIRWMFEIL